MTSDLEGFRRISSVSQLRRNQAPSQESHKRHTHPPLLLPTLWVCIPANSRPEFGQGGSLHAGVCPRKLSARGAHSRPPAQEIDPVLVTPTQRLLSAMAAFTKNIASFLWNVATGAVSTPANLEGQIDLGSEMDQLEEETDEEEEGQGNEAQEDGERAD